MPPIVPSAPVINTMYSFVIKYLTHTVVVLQCGDHCISVFNQRWQIKIMLKGPVIILIPRLPCSFTLPDLYKYGSDMGQTNSIPNQINRSICNQVLQWEYKTMWLKTSFIPQVSVYLLLIVISKAQWLKNNIYLAFFESVSPQFGLDSGK